MSTEIESRNLVLAAALELRDDETCFVGIGIPSLAAMLAKRTHAPRAHLIYESGGIGADPQVPPLSTGSPCIAENAAMLGDCLDVFGELQAGRIDLGLLSAAQVDRFGNLNSTVIGRYESPRLRLVGSGGAHDIASLAKQVVILMPHEPRRFVPQVDFITSPGHSLAGNERAAAGLRGGPSALITGRGRFTFARGEMVLAEVFAPFTVDDALEGLSWQVPVEDTVMRRSDFAPAAAAAYARLDRLPTGTG
ncbi:CoA-transferase subunit beta [Ancylobacter sp. Lp-2]|uniref:CoA-transferase subunit beta n=1 Tax=Ancylobacter sp. Lp-2 TaxID=2881339 RepID=UPI001E3AA8EB|nr:CoA-transferase [Ancylobacter sp. Lp-2]MCB4770398.1 CoA-transferase subunit beta [Ancylobacter sp. Lp-2]